MVDSANGLPVADRRVSPSDDTVRPNESMNLRISRFSSSSVMYPYIEMSLPCSLDKFLVFAFGPEDALVCPTTIVASGVDTLLCTLGSGSGATSLGSTGGGGAGGWRVAISNVTPWLSAGIPDLYETIVSPSTMHDKTTKITMLNILVDLLSVLDLTFISIIDPPKVYL